MVSLLLKRVSLIVPLRTEEPESIMTTLDSIEEIDYPKDLVDVSIVYGRDDTVTRASLARVLREKRYSYRIRVFEIEKSRGLKASDINDILGLIEGDVVGVYDADDRIDRRQVWKVLRAMEEGFVAVSPRVYRYRSTVLGRLVFAETVFWYDLWLRILQRAGLHTPLSGEGLYIRTDVLKMLGGFPETLAEDATLSVLLAREGLRYGYIDSYVEELAPRDIVSLVKQRVRWYRGHLETLYRLLKMRIRRGALARILATYVFTTSSVVLSSSPLVLETYSLATGDERFSARLVVREILNGGNRGTDILYSPFFYSLTIYIGFLGVLSYLLVRHHMYRGRREVVYTILVSSLLLPLYWILIFSSFIASLVYSKRTWLKTVRR